MVVNRILAPNRDPQPIGSLPPGFCFRPVRAKQNQWSPQISQPHCLILASS